MMLRTARRFDPRSNTVIFGDGTPFNRSSLAFGGLKDYVNCMFDFSVGMSRMAVDNTEYALLTAICIFSGWIIRLDYLLGYLLFVVFIIIWQVIRHCEYQSIPPLIICVKFGCGVLNALLFIVRNSVFTAQLEITKFASLDQKRHTANLALVDESNICVFFTKMLNVSV